MSFVTDAASVLAAFNTAFAAAEPTVPIENENIDPIDTSSLDEWIRIIIQEGDNSQITLGRVGNREYQKTGIIHIQVFTKTGIGAGRARELAQTAKGILQGTTFGDVKTGAARVARQGVSGSWWQLNLIVPFRSRELG